MFLRDDYDVIWNGSHGDDNRDLLDDKLKHPVIYIAKPSKRGLTTSVIEAFGDGGWHTLDAIYAKLTRLASLSNEALTLSRSQVRDTISRLIAQGQAVRGPRVATQKKRLYRYVVQKRTIGQSGGPPQGERQQTDGGCHGNRARTSR